MTISMFLFIVFTSIIGSCIIAFIIGTTVEPQSYGLHSYGKLGQPDTEIEYIFGKYHQNFYKRGTGHQV